jgi:hypothetical protein
MSTPMGPHGPQRTVSPLVEVAFSAHVPGEPPGKHELRMLLLDMIRDGCLDVKLTGTDPTSSASYAMKYNGCGCAGTRIAATRIAQPGT